jgi:hypothetical protein
MSLMILHYFSSFELGCLTRTKNLETIKLCWRMNISNFAKSDCPGQWLGPIHVLGGDSFFSVKVTLSVLLIMKVCIMYLNLF